MPGKVGMLVGGRYRLDEVVGHGGMGRVWRGRDLRLNRPVAIKEVILRPQLPEEHAELMARMRREAEAVAQLSHSGIITIHDMVEDDGTPWIVMEFVPGLSLGAELEEKGPLPWQRTAEIGSQIATGLVEAHKAGIVHRDLKPANILLSPGRGAVIIDFGIAQIIDATTNITSTGVRVGTPRYMAPEQLNGKDVGSPADMWTLGVTLYTAVEGRPPFDAPDLIALTVGILTREFPPPRNAGPLQPLIMRLLAKKPADRPTARDVVRALADERLGVPPPVVTVDPPPRWRRIAVVAAVVAAVAALVAAFELNPSRGVSHSVTLPTPVATRTPPAPIPGCAAPFGGINGNEPLGFVTSACFPHDQRVADVISGLAAANTSVLAAKKPYRTVVFFGVITSSDGTTTNPASLYQLRGVLYAQQQNNKNSSKFNVRVLVANAGDEFDDQTDAGQSVAELVVQKAQKDHTIMAVLGIGQSRTDAETAVQTLGKVGLPVIGTSVTGQAMFQDANFFDIAPENESQAQLAASFAKNDLKAKSVLILANENADIKGPNKDIYSDELASEFKADFTRAGGQVINTCEYGEQLPNPTVSCGEQSPGLQGLRAYICREKPDLIFFAGRAVTLPQLFTQTGGGCALPPVLGSSDVPKYASESDLQSIVDAGKATLYYVSYAPAREGGCNSPTVKKQAYQSTAMCTFITSYRNTYGTEESNGPTGNPDNSLGLSYDSSDAMLGNDALQTVVSIIGKSGNVAINGAQAMQELDSGRVEFNGASGYISFPARTQTPPNHPMYITSLGNTLTLKVSCGQVIGGPGVTPVVQENVDCPTAS